MRATHRPKSKRFLLLVTAALLTGCSQASQNSGTGGAGTGGSASGGSASGGGPGDSGAGGGGGTANGSGGQTGDAAQGDVEVDTAPPADANGADGPADGAADRPAGMGLAMGVHTARALGTKAGAPNGYWEYLPRGYGDGTQRPLLVFWHGSGEKGNGSAADLPRILTHGPPKLIAAGQWPADRPFIVLSPQHNLPDCFKAGDAHRDFLTYAVGAYDVDPARVYQTGLSCGAIGTEDFITRHGPAPLAAAVLISGDVTPMWDARGCGLVANLAMWTFHGGADIIVSPAGDNTDMPKFIACPQPPRKDVLYTVYPGVDHDAWTRTYDVSSGNNIYTWLLTQKRP
jgi:predicted esterase